MYDSEQSNSQMLGQQNKVLLRQRWQKSPQHAAFNSRSLQLSSICLVLITITFATFSLLSTPPQLSVQSSALNRFANNEFLLECLQVTPPVAVPPTACRQTLMVHTFAFSYGQPFVGAHNPPDCEFNRIVFNFTVTSAGRQFDRLAIMFFDDIEIFRSSTAEPTREGIMWSYAKDMSSYLALFKQPQKIIFDLGNLVDDTYTGSWHTTLTATYFTAEDLLEPADIIVPVSARRSPVNRPSHFTVPESSAVDALKIPPNSRKAVFSISACGQAAEEFWWSNVLTSDTTVFGDDTALYGHSPFRELQLLIDGQLAGVAWPFPVIFTGGVVPGFWRPIVGIDAFDLIEDEIDITPFLPMLVDGRDHTFEIRVLGITDDGNGYGELSQSIESNWVVTGKLFIWLDTNTSIVAGSAPSIHTPKLSINIFSQTAEGINGTPNSLEYMIQVSRLIHISSTLQTSKGSERVVWTQNLAFSNHGTLKNKGNDQDVQQLTSGHSTSSSLNYSKTFSYPLWVASSYRKLSGDSLAIDATIRRGKTVEQIGRLAFHNDRIITAPQYEILRGTKITNSQNGTASYTSSPAQRKSYGWGSTEQHYLLSGIEDNAGTMIQHDKLLYLRDILAVNGSIIFDREGSRGQKTGEMVYSTALKQVHNHGLHDFTLGGAERWCAEDHSK